MEIKIVSRKIICNGEEEEDMDEKHCKYLETIMKRTGETMEQVLERIYIEDQYEQQLEEERNRRAQFSPNTLDYYLP